MIQIALENQKKYFLSGQTRSYEFRLAQLIKLKESLVKHQSDILEALHQDLNKSEAEGFTTEVGFCLSSLTKAIKELKGWMKVKKVPTPLFLIGSKSYIQPEPRGNVLIIGPFNYPFQLVIEPLIGAIAAGNTAIIKPSELAVYTERIVSKLIKETFDSNYIDVVTGDAQVTTELLRQRWDYIFFTGSPKVGRIVYQAASQHLTPVTLELGGKNPTIVDQSANLKIAARRIVFGKFLNAGQTCIATDYILVHESVKETLIRELKLALQEFYPSNSDYGSIIHERHVQRLKGLIDETKVVYQHPVVAHPRGIAPTILDRINWTDPIMQDEIFGPLLPILTYTSIDEIIALLQTKEKSLALYVFTEDKKIEKKVWNTLSFGSGAVNDTLMQIANPNLPFGGIGQSGIGAYHGQTSFQIFSHHKSFTRRSTTIDLPLGYPPYTKEKMSIIRKFFK